MASASFSMVASAVRFQSMIVRQMRLVSIPAGPVEGLPPIRMRKLLLSLQQDYTNLLLWVLRALPSQYGRLGLVQVPNSIRS